MLYRWYLKGKPRYSSKNQSYGTPSSTSGTRPHVRCSLTAEDKHTYIPLLKHFKGTCRLYFLYEAQIALSVPLVCSQCSRLLRAHFSCVNQVHCFRLRGLTVVQRRNTTPLHFARVPFDNTVLFVLQTCLCADSSIDFIKAGQRNSLVAPKISNHEHSARLHDASLHS